MGKICTRCYQDVATHCKCSTNVDRTFTSEENAKAAKAGKIIKRYDKVTPVSRKKKNNERTKKPG